MSDAWKKHDRPCPPCKHCGAELYDQFFGNAGWAPTDKVTDKHHGDDDCVRLLKARILAIHDLASARLRSGVDDANARHDLTEIVRIAGQSGVPETVEQPPERKP